MTCPDENLLVEFVASALEDAEVRRVEDHLDACHQCRATLVQLARLIEPASDVSTARDHEEEREPGWMLDGVAQGRYLPQRVLGAGGMSLVYAGTDTALHRPVAIKVMLDAPASAAARLLEEAQVLAGLSHSNIVPVFDVESTTGHAFLIEELVDGGSLRTWLSQQPRSTRDVLEVLAGAARGLAAAHAAGVVHRDVTPGNILVGDDGRARVADFGLASLRDHERASALDASSRGTGEQGELRGTPGYIAPEVLKLGQGGPAADQYGLGMVGSEVLTGRQDVPAAVWKVLSRAKAESPEQRFASMAGLASALSEAARSPRRSRWIAVSAVVSVAAIGLASWVVPDTPRPCLDAPAPVSDTDVEVFDALAEVHISSWGEVQGRLCTAAIPDDIFDRRWECLRRFRERLEALAERVDGSNIGSFVVSLEALGDPVSCEDDERLIHWAALPPNPLRDRVDALRTELIGVEADIDSQGFGSIEARLDSLVQQVRELGYAPLLAEVLIAWGRHQRAAGHVPAARRTLSEAAHLAAGAGLDEIAARAWLFLVFVEGRDDMDLKAALETLRFADASLERAGRPAGLMALRARTLGVAYSRRGEHDQATPYLEEAVRQSRALSGNASVVLADALVALGVNQARLGEVDLAQSSFEDAEQMLAERLGPDSPKAGEVLANMAALEFARGEMKRAAEYSRKALARLQPVYSENDARLAVLHGSLGQALYFDGAPIDALEHLLRAHEIRSALFPPEHPAVLNDRYQLSMAYRKLERWSDVEAILAGAESDADNEAVPPHLRGLLFYELGILELQQGSQEEARRLCTRSKKMLAEAGATDALKSAETCLRGLQ
ncbi:MAG: protein kinase domain-containing protein [Nannocystales bacterium]